MANNNQPTPAYVGASWAVMLIGILAYLVGLWNAEMLLNEKGYYFAVLILGLYAAISLQKTIRDIAENIPTSRLYYLVSWVALVTSVGLICIGLWNAQLLLSEKGFYMMSFTMSLFAVITIQKNIRDTMSNQPTIKAEQPAIADTASAEIPDKTSLLQSPFRRNKD
ncbi:inner membrane protein YiaA [Faucicola boevrei]|uniref:inner membrane protein YiaA n=1 Tax=Faucicola boevrei TaxID=346665 RepID=UPI00037A8F34|nr:inner membrane protein YiaA [Moraxella boevrei]